MKQLEKNPAKPQQRKGSSVAVNQKPSEKASSWQSSGEPAELEAKLALEHSTEWIQVVLCSPNAIMVLSSIKNKA